MEKVLVVNPGSTIIKYTLFAGEGKTLRKSLDNKPESLHEFIDLAIQEGLITDASEIEACGVRVVHGGTHFTKPTLMNEAEITAFESIISLAPLHNPHALAQIKLVKTTYPTLPVVIVCDTSFHMTIPMEAKRYPLPNDLVEKYSLYRYGFHGTVCRSALRQVSENLGKTPENMIVCQLGGGCSVTAIKNGQSVETSMGFTPLEGLMMVGRSGDTDAGILFQLARKEGYSIDELETLVNKKSGFFGMVGTLDMYEAEMKARGGDETAILAWDMFVHRLVKYIGAYTAILGGVEVLSFSGGIGENSAWLRAKVCEKIKALGFHMDENINSSIKRGTFNLISAAESPAKIFTVPADEDAEIFTELQKMSF